MAERNLIRDVRLGLTRWVKIVALEQPAQEMKQTGEDKEPELTAFLLTGLMGWPYELIEYRNEGAAPREIRMQDWSERLGDSLEF